MNKLYTQPRLNGSFKSLFAVICLFNLFVSEGFAQFYGPRTLIEEVHLLSPFKLDKIIASDIDNDGDDDIVAAYIDSKTLCWYENIENGNAYTRHLIDNTLNFDVTDNEGLLINTFEVGDLNNDGLQDIMIGHKTNFFDGMVNRNLLSSSEVPEGLEDLYINISDAKAVVGEEICLRVEAYNFDELATLEFLIQYEPSILRFERLDLRTSSLNLSEQQFELPDDTRERLGEVHFAWSVNNEEGVTLDNGAILFELCFTVKRALTTSVRVVDNNDDRAFDKDGDWVEINDRYQVFTNYQNQGNGHFQVVNKIPQIRGDNTNFNILDMDEDGVNDLLMVNNDESLVYLPNDGNGRLGEPIEIISTDRNGVDMDMIRIIDFNRDGRLDIFGADISGSDIFWFPNNGNSSFGSIEFLARNSISSISDIAIFDADEDGWPDLFLLGRASGADSDEGLIQLKGQANLDFAEPIHLGFLEFFQAHPILLPVDLDLDGDLDFLSNSFDDPTGLTSSCRASDSEQCLYWVKNNGGGNFTGEVINVNDLGIESSIFYLTKGNFNSDGIPEPVFMEKDLSIMNIDNNGNAVFQTIDGSSQFNSVEFADFDGDGDQDFIHSNQSSGRPNIIHLHENSRGRFTHGTEIYRTTGEVIYSPKIVDLDLDNDLDILAITESSSRQIRLNLEGIINDGNNLFDNTRTMDLSYPNRSPFKLFDFDKNGTEDVFPQPFLSSSLFVGFNNLSTTFTDSLLLQVSGSRLIGFFDFGDFNQDGLNDIVLTAQNRFATFNDLLIFTQNQDGSFTETELPRPLTESQSNFGSVFSIDFDRDGQMDIICLYGRSILWYSGNDVQQPIIINTFPYSIDAIHIVDYDRDSDNDFIVLLGPDFENEELQLLVNEGNQSYSSALIDENMLIGFRSLLCTVDMDNDGDQDIVITSNRSSPNISSILWYENLSDTPVISGTCFWDENGNGLFDENEKGLNQIQTILEPRALSGFTDQAGQFNYFVADGDYQIFVDEIDSCWQSTTPTMQLVTVDGNTVSDINFGFNLQSDFKHLSPSIRSAPTRCAFEVPFWINIENDGCLSQRGQLSLVLDEAIRLKEALVEPNLIAGDTLNWNLNTLDPTQIESFQLILEMPGVEAIGDSIVIEAFTYNEDGSFAEAYTFVSEIRCAYDPNDKLVDPDRMGNANYTLFEETLEYTIRFQNTGNDTAFTVVIRDTLDENLDLGSFGILSGSHPFTVLLDEQERVVEFTFENILLPDSLTNEPLSHGYVSFSIQPIHNLDEGTLVNNQAGIYFDFNPPIITNTVTNTFVNQLPPITSTDSRKRSQNTTVKAYPNPFTDQVNFEITSTNSALLQLHIYDLAGRLLITQKHKILPGKSKISLDNFHPGDQTYLYKIMTSNDIITGKLVQLSN